MKQNSFIHIIGLSAALLLVTNIYAQAFGKLRTFDKSTLMSSAKNLAAEESDKLALDNMRKINKRMFTHFNMNFKNASGIRISSVDNFTFIYCKVEGIASRILYSKNGIQLNTIRTYGEDQLRPDVRTMVKFGYPEFSIFGAVTEVTVANKTAHFVSIEDKLTWKIIRVVDGEMDVYGVYQKG